MSNPLPCREHSSEVVTLQLAIERVLPPSTAYLTRLCSPSSCPQTMMTFAASLTSPSIAQEHSSEVVTLQMATMHGSSP